MKQISVYMKEPKVTVLGPGVRYGLWVQGCHRNCPGCVAGGSHRMEEGTPVPVGALALEIALSGADGLTISGGEPFLQAEALGELIAKVRSIRPMGVIVYTGYTYEALQKMPEAASLLKQTDLLIDGEYIQELDDGKSLRGSSNQRAIPLTDRYRDEAAQYGSGPRTTEYFYHGSQVHQVGIPVGVSADQENSTGKRG